MKYVLVNLLVFTKQENLILLQICLYGYGYIINIYSLLLQPSRIQLITSI